MTRKKIMLILSALASAGALLSCTATPPVAATGATPATQAAQSANLKLVYSELAKTEGKVFTLDPATSAVQIFAFRGGRAAKLGHNHVLSAPKFTGFFHLPSAGTGEARFDLEFRLDELEIDPPEYRSKLGKNFASELSVEAIDGTREHMLGDENLEADKFPFVRIHSLRISGESPKFAAQVEVEMHGQKRQMWIPLSVEGLPDRLAVTGAFVLRQTDFGAQPYSVLGGLLAVLDEVVIEFKLTGMN